MPDWWFTLDDIGAGGDRSLRLLYETVPAAEERDLLEEAIDAEYRDHLWAFHRELMQSDDESDPFEVTLDLLRRTFHAVILQDHRGP